MCWRTKADSLAVLLGRRSGPGCEWPCRVVSCVSVKMQVYSFQTRPGHFLIWERRTRKTQVQERVSNVVVSYGLGLPAYVARSSSRRDIGKEAARECSAIWSPRTSSYLCVALHCRDVSLPALLRVLDGPAGSSFDWDFLLGFILNR